MTALATSLLQEDQVDPFTAPDATHGLGSAPDRARVVVGGTVHAADVVHWAGGSVLEVTVVDGAGSIVLVFFGRRQVAGLCPGRRLVAEGMVGRHRGRRVILNPAVWLKGGDGAEPAVHAVEAGTRGFHHVAQPVP